MKERVMIVTGANSGMGLATSVGLAKQGIYVIMLCRNEVRGRRALEEAVRRSGSDRIGLMLCDLGSLRSIRACAATFLSNYTALDGLINNAGVVSVRRQTTSDGFEQNIGVNHLGHFLLTNLLMEALQRASQGRIINVSSGAHKIGRIHFDDLHLTRGYNAITAYAQSKLANILFTTALARRLQGTQVTANSLHPGAVATNIGVDRSTGFGTRIMAVLRPFFLTPEEGAATAIYLATSPDVAALSGAYFYRQRQVPASRRAQDAELAERLWAVSAAEVGWNIAKER
ncbi:SDR family oxidoreductase [Paenibacillus thiaminolyticus]|uniref:SDR family oxidoreductase n=1 Tax=Paenibacillus thiaminolyticus TaxID=49283 RepID=A0A3A3GKV1_PANTH|nr:SDR family oxidoreductase [Paenibacillus thiaminolyticus]RJG22989.1 SDR family oxidoreductase [Paenibacillus thiaminolyticus]